MFAISKPGKIYHLLYPAGNFTLCGFKFSALNVPSSSTRALLHMVLVIPTKRSLCKQCAKMLERRSEEKSEPVREIAVAPASRG
jgi:hypothetical protein